MIFILSIISWSVKIAPPPKKMMKVYSSKHSLTESAKDDRLAKQLNASLNRTTSSHNPFGDNYSESGRSARSGNPFSDDGNPFSDNEGGNPFSGKPVSVKRPLQQN